MSESCLQQISRFKVQVVHLMMKRTDVPLQINPTIFFEDVFWYLFCLSFCLVCSFSFVIFKASGGFFFDVRNLQRLSKNVFVSDSGFDAAERRVAIREYCQTSLPSVRKTQKYETGSNTVLALSR